MKINSKKINVVYYRLYENYFYTPREKISPIFTRNFFCSLLKSKTGAFNTRWNITYMDKQSNDIFINCEVFSTLEITLENKSKDIKDLPVILEAIYRHILLFIKQNSFDQFENLEIEVLDYSNALILFKNYFYPDQVD